MSTNRCVLLKLPGKAFGDGPTGLDPGVVHNIAEQVATAVREGVQVAIVIGGGNLFRGVQLVREGLEHSCADYMGVLGTVMSMLAPQDFIDQFGVPARAQTAIMMAQVTEPYLSLRTTRRLEKGRAVVSGVGAGLPYFSMGTVSAQRALEIHYDELLVAKNDVDGVYDDDPNKNPDTHRFDMLTYSKVLRHDLRVVSGSVLALCRDNGLTTCIFGIGGGDAVTRALMGDEIGTLATAWYNLRKPLT